MSRKRALFCSFLLFFSKNCRYSEKMGQLTVFSPIQSLRFFSIRWITLVYLYPNNVRSLTVSGYKKARNLGRLRKKTMLVFSYNSSKTVEKP